MEIKQALGQLDPHDPDHWTGDGLPRIDVMRKLTGVAKLTRQEITNGDPAFTRGGGVTPAVPVTSEDPELNDHAEDEDAKAEPEAEAEAEVDDPQPVVVKDPTPADLDDELVLSLSPKEAMASYDMAVRYTQAVANRCNDLAGARSKIDKEMTDLGRRSDLVSRVIERMKSYPKHHDTSEIRRYLDAQAEARAKRAKAAKQFIQQGTSVKDVVELLTIGSKLDRAMKQRKPERGSTRPKLGMPVQK